MSSLQNKIDFCGTGLRDPRQQQRRPSERQSPRTDLNGFGEISDVCIKRKIRNRMQDLGKPIFVQSEDRCSDGCGSLSERASAAMKGIKDREEYARHACETWLGRAYLRAGLRLQGRQGLLLRCARPRLYPSGVQPVPPWRSSPSRSPRA